MTHTSTEQSEAQLLIEWFAEEDGFKQGTKVPHKWVLQVEQELRSLLIEVRSLHGQIEFSESLYREALHKIAKLEAAQAQRAPLSEADANQLWSDCLKKYKRPGPHELIREFCGIQQEKQA